MCEKWKPPSAKIIYNPQIQALWADKFTRFGIVIIPFERYKIAIEPINDSSRTKFLEDDYEVMSAEELDIETLKFYSNAGK